VDAATSFLSPVLQVLARHRQPAAAIIDARMLSDLPGDADRIDLQALLEEGGSLTLTYDPGQSGACDDRGDVTDEPVDPAFVATALGWDGAVIGSGSGITIAEALLRIYRRPPFPDPGVSGVYSDEPPVLISGKAVGRAATERLKGLPPGAGGRQRGEDRRLAPARGRVVQPRQLQISYLVLGDTGMSCGPRSPLAARGRCLMRAWLQEQLLHACCGQASQVSEFLDGGRPFDPLDQRVHERVRYSRHAGRIKRGEVVAGSPGRDLVDAVRVAPLAFVAPGGSLECGQEVLVGAPAGEQGLACPPVGAGIVADLAVVGAGLAAIHDAVALLLEHGGSFFLPSGIGGLGVEDVPELLAERVAIEHRQ